MPRPRKSSAPQWTPGQASYVLDRLIRDRRVSKTDVSRYMSDMHREIGDLERRLQSLREASGSGRVTGSEPRRRGRPPRAAQAGAAEAPKKGRRRRRSVTAEQRASRQLQGRYLGLIRQIPATRRSQYQKTAKERGREAAIKELQSALGK